MDERTEKLEKLRKSLEESITKIKKDFEDDKTQYTEKGAETYKCFLDEGIGVLEKMLANLPLATEEMIDDYPADLRVIVKWCEKLRMAVLSV